MAFVKYSQAKLDLVGEDVPDWVEEEAEKEKKLQASAKPKKEVQKQVKEGE